MVGLLAIASLATRGDGSTSAPPGSGIANSIGQHLVVVGALVLAPMVLVVGGALFIYAQIFRLQADPVLKEKLRKSRRAGLVLLAIAAGLMIYHLRTGRNPLSFLHLQNPLSRLANAGHGKLPNSDLHRGAHGGISNTDWTLDGAHMGGTRRGDCVSDVALAACPRAAGAAPPEAGGRGTRA